MKGFQLISKKRNRYCAALPEQSKFCFDMAFSVIFIRDQPILHAFIRLTHFFCAVPLNNQDAYTIWKNFMDI